MCVLEAVDATRKQRNVPVSQCVPSLPVALSLAQCRNGVVLVDQCLSEAVICLAPVLLEVGRWDGYPYPPSGRPGMDEIQLRPSAGRDQGITVLCCYPNSAAIFTDMSNNESVPMWPVLTSIKHGISCSSVMRIVCSVQGRGLICTLWGPDLVTWAYGFSVFRLNTHSHTQSQIMGPFFSHKVLSFILPCSHEPFHK